MVPFKTSFSNENHLRLLAETRVTGLNASNEQLAAECEQLKASVTNWANASALRDQHIQEANDQIRKLSDELNASIHKFNALVTNYNNLAHDMEMLRSSRTATNAPPP